MSECAVVNDGGNPRVLVPGVDCEFGIVGFVPVRRHQGYGRGRIVG
jgi:hypothetical protein